MARLYTVRRLKIGHTDQMDALARAAGDLYSQVVLWFWRTVRHKDLWLNAKHLMRWLTSPLLHAHSSDAVVQSFFAALASWRERLAMTSPPQAPLVGPVERARSPRSTRRRT
jgi:putative transposase